MRRRTGLALAAAAAGLLQGACTTVLYRGPQRPPSQIAVVKSRDTVVENVDELAVRDMAAGSFARLEVLPGVHQMGISLYRAQPELYGLQHPPPMVVCVELEAGHTYRTRAKVDVAPWMPEIVDETTKLTIDSDCDHPDRKPTPGSAAEASGRHPGSGLSLFMGFGLGAASAGTGLVLGVGGMVTPFWATENVGLGLGLDVALNYNLADQDLGASGSRRDFPVALTAHLLTNGSGGPGYFLLKGGVIRDFGVEGEGRLGPTGALGYYRRSNDDFAWDVMLFAAITNHVVNLATVNANSFGLTMALHYNL